MIRHVHPVTRPSKWFWSCYFKVIKLHNAALIADSIRFIAPTLPKYKKNIIHEDLKSFLDKMFLCCLCRVFLQPTNLQHCMLDEVSSKALIFRFASEPSPLCVDRLQTGKNQYLLLDSQGCSELPKHRLELLEDNGSSDVTMTHPCYLCYNPLILRHKITATWSKNAARSIIAFLHNCFWLLCLNWNTKKKF